MRKSDKILVTGANGMVGSQLVKKLKELGYINLLTPTSKDLNLTDQVKLDDYIFHNEPDYVFHLAAKVGGIKANIDDPVKFLSDNLLINTNLFRACSNWNVKKILYLGSSCIYPKDCQQPMKEKYLMTGPLEPTNEGYALSKIVGLKLAEYYHKQYGLKTVCLMPCNIYGTNDHYDLKSSHVLSALIKRFVDAKKEDKQEVVLWGSGIARREFIHVEDVIDSILYFMDRVNVPDIINIGTGIDQTIKKLSKIVAKEVKYEGEIKWDTSKPNGMLKKCMNIEKMQKLGFKPKINLIEGIRRSIKEYVENH
jgi:GDP-L-fucose synthase